MLQALGEVDLKPSKKIKARSIYFTGLRKVWNLISNFIHFLFHFPAQSHLFIIYSLCRMDDERANADQQVKAPSLSPEQL